MKTKRPVVQYLILGVLIFLAWQVSRLVVFFSFFGD